MEQIINSIIKRDVEQLTKWNWLGVAESIGAALDINWFYDLIPEPVYDSLKTLSNNLTTVYNKYFIWKESSGKPPISVYTYIYENWYDILDEITAGLAVDVMDDPLSYDIRLAVEFKLKEFPENLLQVGYIHKFDIDHAKEFFFPEEDEEEN